MRPFREIIYYASVCSLLALPLTAQAEGERTSETPEKRAVERPAQIPAHIPSGYIATPFGYFHSECLYEQHQDGSVSREGDSSSSFRSLQEAPVCPHARYQNDGTLIEAHSISSQRQGDSDTPTSLSWMFGLEYQGAHGQTAPYNLSLSMNTRVLSNPEEVGGQHIYLISAMTQNNRNNISAAVIGWNQYSKRNNDYVPGWTGIAWSIVASSGAVAQNTGDEVLEIPLNNSIRIAFSDMRSQISTLQIILQNVNVHKYNGTYTFPDFSKNFEFFPAIFTFNNAANCKQLPSNPRFPYQVGNLTTYDSWKWKATSWPNHMPSEDSDIRKNCWSPNYEPTADHSKFELVYNQTP